MGYIDKFNIDKKEYEVEFDRNVGVNEVSTLINIPVNKRMVYAKLSGDSGLGSGISVQSGMEIGDELTVVCECTSNMHVKFLPNDQYVYLGKQGLTDPESFSAGEMFKLYITKIQSDKYVVRIGMLKSRNFVSVTAKGSSPTPNIIMYKIDNPSGDNWTQINIPANADHYKLNNLKYGFKTSAKDKSSHEYIDNKTVQTITEIDVNSLNTTNITNMAGMFRGCTTLSSIPGLSRMKTTGVTDMSRMFQDCKSINTFDLSSFDFSLVANASHMFDGITAEVSGKQTVIHPPVISTSSLTNVSYMFANILPPPSSTNSAFGKSIINVLSKLDVSNVSDMSYLFYHSNVRQGGEDPGAFTPTFRNANKVANMTGMLQKTDATKIELGNTFGLCKPTTMKDMFADNAAVEQISATIDLSEVVDISGMFRDCPRLKAVTLSGNNAHSTPKLKNMKDLFKNCKSVNSNTSVSFNNNAYWFVSLFDSRAVTDMSGLFEGCREARTSAAMGNIEMPTTVMLDTRSVTNASMMFKSNDSKNIVIIKSSKYDSGLYDTMNNITDTTSMFEGCQRLEYITFKEGFNAGKVTKMDNMFAECNKLTSISCTQAFRDWCWKNQDTIKLPAAMRSGGSGTWTIQA